LYETFAKLYKSRTTLYRIVHSSTQFYKQKVYKLCHLCQNFTILQTTIHNFINKQHFTKRYNTFFLQTPYNTLYNTSSKKQLYNTSQTLPKRYTIFTKLYTNLHKSNFFIKIIQDFCLHNSSALFNTLQHCTQLCQTIQNYTKLYQTIPNDTHLYTTLQKLYNKSTTLYNTLQYFLQHSTTLHTILQHYTQLYTTLHKCSKLCNIVHNSSELCCLHLQNFTQLCTTLQIFYITFAKNTYKTLQNSKANFTKLDKNSTQLYFC